MIKIRYADLPQGLHAHLHTGGPRPVIYLLPGLSPAQRRDALRRLIRTSRQGYGPRLRAPGVAFAVARDVAKTTSRTGLAVIRCHPAGSLALGALLTTAVICYSLFVTVTVRFTPHPALPPAAAGGVPSPSPAPGTRGPGGSPGSRAGTSGGTQPAVTVQHGPPPAGSATSGVDSGTGTAPSRRSASPAPLPTGTWSAPGGVLPSASAGPSSPARPSTGPPSGSSTGPSAAPPSASPGSPSGHPGGLCLQLGPLGVCVSA